MTRHAPNKVRIEIILPADLLARLDAARGLVPRAVYLRDLIGRALS